MKMKYDHDLHIHSQISSCSNHPLQTTDRILQYAKDNQLHTICLTDHFWDERVPGASDWYAPQNFDHISQALPLPQCEGIRFLFGCETELDQYCTLGISKERMEAMDFFIIPTNHIHMIGYTLSEEDSRSLERMAALWIERLEKVLSMDLPFHKIGIAHLTGFLYPKKEEEQLEMLSLINEEDMYKVFTKAAEVGVGIELNLSTLMFPDDQMEVRLKPMKIAKECGCKFYFGSDAHGPSAFENLKGYADRVIDYLGLGETDQFTI